jgi:hypothetical protein
MPDTLSFGSREYLIFLFLLAFSRAADFFSTWIATPNMVLEANPIARKLGWKWGIPVNAGLCVGFACGRCQRLLSARQACWWRRETFRRRG